MKNRILADTTIWIEFFRGRPIIADHLEMLLMENAVWTCGVVMFEILQGIKSEGEKNKILGALASLPYVEMMKKLWQNAAEFSKSLKKNGTNLPLSDIFISAIAVENDFAVYTLDNHFEQVPGVKIY